MGMLVGKVTLVTGASSGIGKQVAIRFAHEGARVAVCARRTERLEQTAAQCREAGAEVVAVTCDVSQAVESRRFVEATVERFGAIDVLVNNVTATPPIKPFTDQSTDDLDVALQTGLYSYWTMMQLCYPHLRGRSSSIINFTSGAYREGTLGMSTYVADKAAIRGLSMVVAREWGKDGIRCNTISPLAMTDTVAELMPTLPQEIQAKFSDIQKGNVLGRFGDAADDIAPVVAFLASDASRWITGQNINADGGLESIISI